MHWSPKQGGQVVLDDFLPTSPTRDYQTEALKVMNSGADTIFTATDDPADALDARKGSLPILASRERESHSSIPMTNISRSSILRPTARLRPASRRAISRLISQRAFQAKYNIAPDYAGALGYDFIRSITGALAANNWDIGTVASSVVAYHYADPAITGFQFLPDRTVSFQLELWEAQNGHYAIGAWILK